MARLAAAAVALLLPRAGAVLLSHRESGSDLSCVCMNWADVYKAKRHNAPCGSGLELFHVLDQMSLGIPSDVRHKMTLAKSSVMALGGIEWLKSHTSAYTEFCNGFFERANFNYCVNKRFMMREEQLATSKGSWCYVSGKCRAATPLPGTDLAVKVCNEDTEVSLGTMSIDAAVQLGQKQGLDQGIIAGYAYLYKDMLVSEVNNQDIKEMQDKTEGTLIWSMRDHFAPRWVVRGESIYEHRIAPGGWNVTCIRGCKK